MDNTRIISQERKPGHQVKVRIQQTLRTDPMLSLPVSLTGIPRGATLQEVIAQDLSEVSGELQRLPSGVDARETNRDFNLNVPKTLMLTLKRFDSYGNKISDPVLVPNGEIWLDKRGAHQVKGFVVHLGESRHNGHYVEFQKVGDQWFLNNDEKSTPISTAAAIHAMQDAYILYAERP